MIGRTIFSLIGIGIGFVLVWKARGLVERITGPIGFAERYFGGGTGGGTYNFYRLLGMAIMLVSLLIMVGAANFIYVAITQGLSGVAPQVE